MGVGYYPNSSFVHLDVRNHFSYWVDYAGPVNAPLDPQCPERPVPLARRAAQTENCLRAR